MRLLVSGCTVSMRRFLPQWPDRLGVLLTPANGNREWWDSEMVWACDNDCFKRLDAPAYLRLLARVVKFQSRPAWVACPDVVGNAAETVRRFGVWQPLLAELGLPVAFVGQDGLRAEQVPWERIAAFFVGGSTAWKLSDDALALTRAAHERGKLCHFGRVNSARRILWVARAMRDGRGWCDTIDGGSASRWGDVNIPKLMRWMGEAITDRQQVLFGGNA